jgi:NSS family neurotransmitter:Na+ symporter
LPLVGMDFLSLWDLVWGNLSLSIGAFMVALFVAYVWKSQSAVKEIKQSGDFVLAPVWRILIQYVSPALILFILLSRFFWADGAS